LHCDISHCWKLQTAPIAVQFWQDTPENPHATLLLPGEHMPFEQQPLHVCGPHGGGPWHIPPPFDGTQPAPCAWQF
jgi:hypothetical protein